MTTTRRRRLLDQAEALYRPGFYPEIRPIPAMKARLAIAAGRPGAGDRMGADREIERRR